MSQDAEIDKEYQEMMKMAYELMFDANENWKDTEKEDRTKPSVGEVEEASKQRHLRNYSRSAFAAIEGMCFMLRHSAIRFDERKVARMGTQPSFTDGYKARMLEKNQQYLKFPDNIKESFKCYARLTPNGQGYQVDYARAPEWGKLKAANGKRGKLMHPKHRVDLQISYEELDATREALSWFYEQFGAAMDAHVKYIKEKGY